MTTITHLLYRARAHPLGLLLGGASGVAVHHWLATTSRCVATFLQGCTPEPPEAAPALLAYALVGMALGVFVAGTLRDRPDA